MRAHEFITEASKKKPKSKKTRRKHERSISRDVIDTLPSTYIIPELKNQDPYMQYRFGLELVNAKSKKSRERESGEKQGKMTSQWGENEIIVSYGEDVGPLVDQALRQLGVGKKVKVTSTGSREPRGADKSSLLKGFSGFSK